MDKIVRYEVLQPIILASGSQAKRVSLGIPEGADIGFDGRSIYRRANTVVGSWEKTLTEKRHLIKWVENGFIRRIRNDAKNTTQAVSTEAVKQADAEAESQAPEEASGIHENKSGVPEGSPLLPVVHQGAGHNA